jgi:hypothetical protein
LRYLGRFFPRFLKDCSEAVDLPCLSDLAALEWARVEVFDAADAELLRVEHLQNLSPDDWPTLKFRVIPALQILHTEWPVHEIWDVAEAEEAPALLRDVNPEPTTLRVWRESFSVYHTKIDILEKTALDCLLGDQPFASVCAALESVLSAEDAASTVGSLLLRWIEDGILERFSSS